MPPTSLPANASLIARQMNFFPAKDVWDDLGLQLRRTKVKDGWQADHVPSEQAVHVPTCAAPPELGVDDELDVT
jgi:hypothetical protein